MGFAIYPKSSAAGHESLLRTKEAMHPSEPRNAELQATAEPLRPGFLSTTERRVSAVCPRVNRTVCERAAIDPNGGHADEEKGDADVVDGHC
jgi:hypothetical protein